MNIWSTESGNVFGGFVGIFVLFYFQMEPREFPRDFAGNFSQLFPIYAFYFLNLYLTFLLVYVN